MKLTYWIAVCNDDNRAYSVRAKTRKAVIAEVASRWNPDSFDAPQKIEVEYADALDLVMQVAGEGGYGFF